MAVLAYRRPPLSHTHTHRDTHTHTHTQRCIAAPYDTPYTPYDTPYTPCDTPCTPYDTPYTPYDRHAVLAYAHHFSTDTRLGSGEYMTL